MLSTVKNFIDRFFATLFSFGLIDFYTVSMSRLEQIFLFNLLLEISIEYSASVVTVLSYNSSIKYFPRIKMS